MDVESDLLSVDAQTRLSVNGRKLDIFHHRYLQPDENFLDKVRCAIRNICESLKKPRCFQNWPGSSGPPKVLKIVKGGSLGKGTSLKRDSDADLVLFLNIVKSYTNQKEFRKAIIEEVKRLLTECQEELELDFTFQKSEWKNPRVLSFHSKYSEEYIDFDVLPAFDALGHFNGSRPLHEVYISLIKTGTYGEFSPCFTELQKDFIVRHPTKLKSLIRLVKYWYKKLPEQKSLPPKYALELLAVYAWEKGSGKTSFDMAEGFRTVLWLIERHKDLCIFWTTYYDFENETIKQFLYKQLERSRPVILDPADPTGNVGEGKDWKLLAKQAAFYVSRRDWVKPNGSPVQPWDVPVEAMDLRFIDADELDAFHFHYLQPDKEFLCEVELAIHKICGFLKERCFQDPGSASSWSTKVLKIVKGGSLGKGTSLKRDSDADLVLFLNIIRSYTDQERLRKTIIEEVKRRFRECQEELNLDFIFLATKWQNPRVFSFRIPSKHSEEYIDFDVLPVFDALGHFNGSRPDPEVYVSLINTGTYGQFSPCFTELQRHFIIGRPPKLKSLIRLVKYWYNKLPEQKSLPPKYALELLAVYAWEEGSGQDSFDLAEGFRTVLWLIERHKRLFIFWTKYYGFENETIKQFLYKQFEKPRPVLLDPANPSENVGERKDWDLLAKQATIYAFERCCVKPDGSPVQPWNVPVQALDLRFIDAHKLDTFHFQYLQPDEEFLCEVELAIHKICEFLKERCFQDRASSWPPKVMKIIKGGSLWKGTSLKRDSDADLVLFPTILICYTDPEKFWETLIEDVKRRFTECQEELKLDFIFLETKWKNPRVFSFRIRSYDSEEYIDFDVLPVRHRFGPFNGSRPHPEVYTSLINTGTYSWFSPCFIELQRDFINGHPAKLKSLIRLLKYWYKKLPEQKSLPPKYALELLAVYAWEQGSGQDSFDLAEGFRTVLWLIERHKRLCIFWTKYYGFENETIKQFLYKQFEKPRPVLLDPADPTGNVGEGKDWDLLAKQATIYASERCCVKPDGSPVQPWNVPLINYQVLPDPMGNVREGKDWNLLAKQATTFASHSYCGNPEGSAVQPWNVPLEVPLQKEEQSFCAIL